MNWNRIIRHIRWLLPAMAAAVLAPAPAAGGADTAAEEFVRWAESARIPIAPGAGNIEDSELAAYLDEALAGKRIIYLGASDHWIREKYDYRLRFIRLLFARGWRTIGMEMDHLDGRRVDRYLASGDSGELDRVALYGYTGGKRPDRNDRPEGFAGFENPALRASFRAEENRFLGELRSLNAALPPDGKRLRWFGFDIGMMPTVGYEELDELLADQRSQLLVREILDRLERAPGESRLEEAGRLEKLHADLVPRSGRLAELIGLEPTKLTLRFLRHMAVAYRFLDAAMAGPSTPEWMAALPVRERAMCALTDEILAGLPADEKIILLGHNLHLNLDSESIRFGPPGSPAPTMWRSIGTHMARRFPGEIHAVWMTYDHGRHGSVLSPAAFEDVASVPGTVESLLAGVGTGFLIDLDGDADGAAYLDRERMFRQNGSISSAVLREQADAVVFFDGGSAPEGR